MTMWSHCHKNVSYERYDGHIIFPKNHCTIYQQETFYPTPTRVFLEKAGPKTFIYWNSRKFLLSCNRKESARTVKMGRVGTDRGKIAYILKFVVFLLMLCFRSKAYLLYLIIKSILRRTRVQLRGCWHDTGASSLRFPLMALVIWLHDTTTKCRAGASHPGVSPPRLLYRGEKFTSVRNLVSVSCKRETTTCFGVKSVCR